jgi:hypothetical protein
VEYATEEVRGITVFKYSSAKSGSRSGSEKPPAKVLFAHASRRFWTYAS